MIDLIIDGVEIRVERGTTILQAARGHGIDIPTLCEHPGLQSEGNCRLCSVEITEKAGHERIVVSCMYPIRGSMEVKTKSDRVLSLRRTILQLLVNRNPKAPIIRTLCKEYDVTPEERFSSEPDLCIRCGRCVRACETNGNSAIELVGRGFDLHVAPPYELRPESCIGCLSCQSVCPTGKITFEESPGKRTIWKRGFETIACNRCGVYFATKEMLDWAGVSEDERCYCERCRKALTSATFVKKG